MNAVSRGIRLLLASPLLKADDDGFKLITENHEPIARWFEHHCGWQLYVERRYVLLRKTGQRPDATRPARTTTGAPFDRRRYELLCLVCAELLDVPVTTATLLKARVAAEPALDDVLEYLERLGVLRYAEGRYRVDRALIRRLVEPSTVEASPEQEAMRRLVDEPVVYEKNLSVDREGIERAGFIVEERTDGVLLVDPDGLATDTRFPDDDSHAKTVALALVSRLPATKEVLEAHTRDLVTKYRAYRSTPPDQLAQDALDVLVSFGLATQDGTTAQPLPAAARYRP